MIAYIPGTRRRPCSPPTGRGIGGGNSMIGNATHEHFVAPYQDTKGPTFYLFHPYRTIQVLTEQPPLFATPEVWVDSLRYCVSC